MAGAVHRYLSDDHARLDALLAGAAENPDVIDMRLYAEFRKGLLRHISIEEKIVIPGILGGTGNKHRDLIGRLRLDHGALVSLLVPPPSRSIVATIQSILHSHNPLEEEQGGLYDIGALFAGTEEEMLSKMKSAPEVPVLPHNERPVALEAARRAVERAGHEFKGG